MAMLPEGKTIRLVRAPKTVTLLFHWQDHLAPKVRLVAASP